MRGGPSHGGAGGGAGCVPRVMPRAGRATAPAATTPSMASATWTAQSARPRSLNSRVPSTGSMIQTRAASSRAQVVTPLLGQDGVAGRCLLAEQLHQQVVGAQVAFVPDVHRVEARTP